jgi:DNA-3-methyladenine glycosylase I
MDMSVVRCRWAEGHPLLEAYHDKEWGARPRSDVEWFESIVLETLQAGLSWRTVLLKREAFRQAFERFDLDKVSSMTPTDVDRMMNDATLIRHRAKLESVIVNARIAKERIAEEGSLAQAMDSRSDSPTSLLKYLSSTFRFVGPTTAMSIAHATGLLPTPHEPHCFAFAE